MKFYGNIKEAIHPRILFFRVIQRHNTSLPEVKKLATVMNLSDTGHHKWSTIASHQETR